MAVGDITIYSGGAFTIPAGKQLIQSTTSGISLSKGGVGVQLRLLPFAFHEGIYGNRSRFVIDRTWGVSPSGVTQFVEVAGTYPESIILLNPIGSHTYNAPAGKTYELIALTGDVTLSLVGSSGEVGLPEFEPVFITSSIGLKRTSGVRAGIPDTADSTYTISTSGKGIAVSDDRVYVADPAADKIYSFNKATRAQIENETINASGTNFVDMAFYGGQLWTLSFIGGNPQTNVYNTDGTEDTSKRFTLSARTGSIPGIISARWGNAIAVDDNYIYLTREYASGTKTPIFIQRHSRHTGTFVDGRTLLWRNISGRYEVFEDFLYTRGNPTINGITVRGNYLYLQDFTFDKNTNVHKSTNNAPGGADGYAMDDTHFYYLSSNTVRRTRPISYGQNPIDSIAIFRDVT